MNSKNYSLIFNAILLIAVIVLFVLHFKGAKSTKNKNELQSKNDSTQIHKMPIAYINMDSLLINYTFAKEANESLISKQENSRATLNSKARKLQTEMDEFNRKWENGAFLSRQRAEDAQGDILKKQQELQVLEGNLSKQLIEQQQKMGEQLRDTIEVFLKVFNANGRYQMILSNTTNDNVLQADDAYDITEEVIEKLNERYTKGKK